MSDETTTVETTAEAPAQDAQPEQQSTDTAEVTTETTNKSTEETQESSKPKADDISEWASKKGLTLNADNPNEVKLAKMQREAEKKMHESTAQASELKSAVTDNINITPTGDSEYEQLATQVQQLQLDKAINDFYAQKPEARELDSEMAQLVQENPNLAAGGLEALYAVAKTRRLDSGGEDALKKEGGRKALENAALKQQAAAVAGNATTSTPSSNITSADVQAALQRGDREWIGKHMKEIDAL